MSAALHNAARIMAAEVTEIEHKENISDDVPADTNTTDIIDIVKNEKAGITDSESKAVEKYGVSENSVAGNIVSHIRLRYLVQKELRGMGWKEEENSGMISEISFGTVILRRRNNCMCFLSDLYAGFFWAMGESAGETPGGM